MAAGFPPCSDPDCDVDEEEKRKIQERKPSCELAERCVSACAAYGKVCPCSARIAALAACDAMRKLKDDSDLFVGEETEFTKLNSDDIVIGKQLGEGGFSYVNSCEVSGKEYAVKYLKRKVMVDLHDFKHGASDLATEACFLQRLSHPNIVNLHGITAGSVETNVANGKECGFFIVVDRLHDTLEERIATFRRADENKGNHFLARFSNEAKTKKREILKERIRIAYSIANAMEYLHAQNVVFRDLKPDNCGFDESGVLKLFDFGLAKELKSTLRKENGRYEMTGNTGSRRYMAPEVAKNPPMPYDKSVDVYSFGILLWELCTAVKPFYGYSADKHMRHVVLGGERPKMDAQHAGDWPENLKLLVTRCWSPFPVARPTFKDIKVVLQDILESRETVPACLVMADEDVSESSTGSYRRFFRVRRQSARMVGPHPHPTPPAKKLGLRRITN